MLRRAALRPRDVERVASTRRCPDRRRRTLACDSRARSRRCQCRDRPRALPSRRDVRAHVRRPARSPVAERAPPGRLRAAATRTPAGRVCMQPARPAADASPAAERTSPPAAGSSRSGWARKFVRDRPVTYSSSSSASSRGDGTCGAEQCVLYVERRKWSVRSRTIRAQPNSMFVGAESGSPVASLDPHARLSERYPGHDRLDADAAAHTFDTGPCELFLKLESMNPGGSIKDRIALSMIEDAEQRGELQAGRDDRRSDRRQHWTRSGPGRRAEGLLAGARHSRQDEPGEDFQPARDGRGGRHDPLRRREGASGVLPGSRPAIARERGAYFIDQFGNPANPLAHERGTAPEIWEQMQHRLDAVVLGVGSSGTVTGLSRLLRRERAARRDRARGSLGSILAEYVTTGKVRQKGAAGSSRESARTSFPTIADFSLITRAYSITDARVVRHSSRAAAARRRPGRFLHRDAARRDAALLPRADAGPSAS